MKDSSGDDANNVSPHDVESAQSLEDATIDAAASQPPSQDSQDNVQPGAYREGFNDGDDEEESMGIDESTARYEEQEEGLVTAEAVDQEELNREVEERMERKRLERSREIAEAAVVTGFWCSRRVKIGSAIVAVLAIAGIVLGTVLPRAFEPPEPTPMPTPAPTSILSGLTEFLATHASFDGGAALRTPSTPQNKALIWLANDTGLDSYSNERKIQRYALATFYISTKGENWFVGEWWLSAVNECDWYYEDGPLCIDNAVVELDFWDGNIGGTLPAEIALLGSLSE